MSPTTIAVFHSALGVRPGVLDAAARLRAAGHDVRVVDQYDGRVFDDYGSAGRFVEQVGFPALMGRALDAVTDLPDDLVVLGFSNGAGMAEHVATQRPVSRAVLVAGALPLTMLGVQAWPTGVPVQLHYALDDPHRSQEWIDVLTAEVRETARLDAYDYAGSGHLFTDPSLPQEYDAVATDLLWERVLAFCAEPAAPAAVPTAATQDG